MVTKEEALKLALEALEDKHYQEAHYLIVQALAQPAQEPVGYEHHEYRPYGAPGEIRIHAILASQYTRPDGSVVGDYQWLVDEYKLSKNTIKLIPLYTTPPQRPWVGLTDDEEIADFLGDEYHTMTEGEYRFFKLGVQASKEKNT